MDGKLIKLANFVPKEADLSQKLVPLNFKGIDFNIRYVSRATLAALANQCVTLIYDPKQKGRVSKLNTEEFIKKIATTIVKGWANCTLNNLANLMPVETEGLDEETLNAEIPFNEENLLMVVQNVHDLDTALQEAAVDASFFRANYTEELEKNSSTSQSGT